ncbi:MAG: ABC transporter substrate-binding protein, partial [Persicimonas sp.]
GLGESDAEREELEDLFNRTAPYMVEVRASERAAEMSMRLAAAGGPKRLAIGFLLPLSGSSAAIGERLMAGALVAMRAFYDAGDPQVTLVFEDSQGDASEAFERLVDHDVLAVVGPVDRKRAKRFAPLAMEAELPLITLTTESVRAVLGDDQAADSEDADGRDDDRSRDDTDEPDGEKGESAEGEDDADTYVFRNFIDAAAEARAVARIAFDEIGDRRAAIVKPDIGYGDVTSRAFADEFEELGGRIVADIEYDRGESDFSDVASRVAEADPEAVFLPDSAEKVAEVTSFFANENIWGLAPDQKPPARSSRTHVHYLGTSLWEHPMLVRQASDYVEGAAIPVWFSPSVEDPVVEQFVQRFEAIYEREPDSFEAFSYDTVSWLRSLMLERGMRRPSAIRDGLLAGDVHEGVTGRARMTERAEAARSLRFVTPTDDGFETLPFSGAAIRREEDDDQSDPDDMGPNEAPGSTAPRGGSR